MRTVKIAFSDLWDGFDSHDNAFVDILKEDYLVEVKEEMQEADFLIYSCFGKRHEAFKGIKIFFTAESRWPNWAECDYAFTFERFEDEKHMRLPYYYFVAVTENKMDYRQQISMKGGDLEAKKRFCSFVYSNPRGYARNRFFDELSRYKRVDSGGRFRNNIGGPLKDKLTFVSESKFTFAYENRAAKGYITEKLFQPLIAGSVPLYWGCPEVAQDFNPQCFIHARDFKTDKALRAYVEEVDQNDELYAQFFGHSIFAQPDQLEQYHDRLKARLREIVEEGKITRFESSSLYYGLKRFFFGKKMKLYRGRA